jgi:hypothetical protein
MIYAFDWLLVRAPAGGLITSDRGYAIQDPSPPFPWAAQRPLSSPHSETFVPLSDSTGLFMRPGNADCDLAVTDLTATFREETPRRRRAAQLPDVRLG